MRLLHGGHAHKDCNKVTDIKECKDIFRKYARSFVCAFKGHLARECRSNRSCEQCGGRHHVLIREGKNLQVKEIVGKSATAEPSVPLKQESSVTVVSRTTLGQGKSSPSDS